MKTNILPEEKLDPGKIETELISYPRVDPTPAWTTVDYDQIYFRIETNPTVTPGLRDVRRTEPLALKRLCQCKILEQTHHVLMDRENVFPFLSFQLLAQKTTTDQKKFKQSINHRKLLHSDARLAACNVFITLQLQQNNSGRRETERG